MKATRRLVTFRLDDRIFALHVSAVERIIQVVEMTPLPKAPDSVAGVVNLQGRILPVFDFRLRFRLPARKVQLGDQLIIAETTKRSVALLVDSVDDVIEIRDEDITAAEQILPGLEYVEGVVKMPDGMVLIHDLSTFLSPRETRVLDEAMETLSRNERTEE